MTVFYLNQRDVREVVGVLSEPRAGRGVGMTVDSARTLRTHPAGRAEDEALLRRFEPILRFTLRRAVLPDAGDGYLTMCDLLSGPTPTTARVVIPKGSLDAAPSRRRRDRAAGRGRCSCACPGAAQPDRARPVQRAAGAAALPAPGRLARVGILARMLDAGLVASLLVRGKVPGGTAAAAAVKYEAQRATDPRVSYHGRVVRRDGWVVLQYLFFYAMNDWRSTFEGANDHEADWEQAFVILEETARRRRAPRLVRGRRARREGRGPPPPLGRPEAPARRRARRRLPGGRLACDVHGAGRVHHAARRCPARTSCGPSWTTSGRSGATSSASRTRATSPRRSRACSASRSSTTPEATGTASGRGRRSSGRRS